jgi:hypothetical protein
VDDQNVTWTLFPGVRPLLNVCGRHTLMPFGPRRTCHNHSHAHSCFARRMLYALWPRQPLTRASQLIC